MNTQHAPEKEILDSERRDVLVQLESWLETPMLVLSFVWLALFVVEMIGKLNPLLETIGITIWVIFVLDFVLKFTIAPHKLVV